MVVKAGSKEIHVNLEAVKNYTYDELAAVYKGDVLTQIAKAAGIKKPAKKKRVVKESKDENSND